MGRVGNEQEQRKELVKGKREYNKLRNMNNWVKENENT